VGVGAFVVGASAARDNVEITARNANKTEAKSVRKAKQGKKVEGGTLA